MSVLEMSGKATEMVIGISEMEDVDTNKIKDELMQVMGELQIVEDTNSDAFSINIKANVDSSSMMTELLDGSTVAIHVDNVGEIGCPTVNDGVCDEAADSSGTRNRNLEPKRATCPIGTDATDCKAALFKGGMSREQVEKDYQVNTKCPSIMLFILVGKILCVSFGVVLNYLLACRDTMSPRQRARWSESTWTANLG